MKFGQSFVAFWKNYATFGGRARRSEYWYAVLAVSAITFVVALFSISTDYYGNLTYGPLYYIWALAIFVPSLSITARRLHDAGKSFGYYFLALIPVVGTILVLVALTTDSQPSANKFGEPVEKASGS